MLTIFSAHLDDHIPQWHNPGVNVPNHIIVLVTEGRLIYKLDGAEYTARKGDVMLIPAGTYREAYNDADQLHQKIAIYFNTTSDIHIPLVEQQQACQLHVRAVEFYRERFHLLYKHYVEGRAYYRQICSGILLEILGHLQRELTAPPLQRRKLQHAAALEQHIVEHFREPLILGRLAELISRSPNYTLALFKEATGMTPTEYQHQLRIHSAAELLEQTDLTVAAIAAHLGYYDASSFYKMFRKKTGMSPSEFRITKQTKQEG
ncbi:AraC family transcriptional regulator [Paenibacillus sp. PL2-23]|uniref:AraC family transcriptional regulator n=1 Tax=Paenibacillus sp. PL2-23 TaxID=2100729 RepID=UPI0030F9425C